MKLLGLLPGIIATVARVFTGASEKSAAAILESALQTISPKERAELEAALIEHEARLAAIDLEALKAMVAETNTMTASEDGYVRRARPTGLYALYVVVLALAGALIAGVTIDPAAILTLVTPLGGASAYYMKLRSDDKRTRNGNGA
jgi:hypothetical protein